MNLKNYKEKNFERYLIINKFLYWNENTKFIDLFHKRVYMILFSHIQFQNEKPPHIDFY